MAVGLPEFVDNPEPRCPVVLLLDISYSMDGSPISELNQGIRAFEQSVKQDAAASARVEVAIVSFGGLVRLVQDFVTADDFSATSLAATGNTPMGEAIIYALDLLEDRKKTYKSNGIQYYQPWILLITDGAPTDQWQHAAQRIKQAENDKKISFFSVAVKGADINTLKQIAPDTRPPLELKGLNFKDMFIWLSQSVSIVSSQKVGGGMTDLPPIGWGQAPT